MVLGPPAAIALAYFTAKYSKLRSGGDDDGALEPQTA